MSPAVTPKGATTADRLAIDSMRVNQRFTLDDFDVEDRASSITSSGSGNRTVGGALDPTTPGASNTSRIIADAIRQLQSSQWNDKRAAIDALRQLFNAGGRMLSAADIRRLMDAFGRCLNDVTSRNYALFIDAIIDFVANYNTQLNDWLPFILGKLMHKMTTESNAQ